MLFKILGNYFPRPLLKLWWLLF